MDMEEFLRKNKIINKSQLVRSMWNISNDSEQLNTVKVQFNNKVYSKNGQKMLADDYKDAFKVLDALVSDIKKLKKDNPTK